MRCNLEALLTIDFITFEISFVHRLTGVPPLNYVQLMLHDSPSTVAYIVAVLTS